jgi:transposase
MSQKKWKTSEIRWMKENASTMSSKEIANHFGVSVPSFYYQKDKHKIQYAKHIRA